MHYLQHTDAVILKTYDIQEADRLCILLTQHYGKVVVRASGTRRILSKFGGCFLPFCHIQLEMKDSRGMRFVTGAYLLDSIPISATPTSFATATQGVELLLVLIEEEEPLPQIFALTLDFLHLCTVQPNALLLPTFSLRLLHLLGLLPSPDTPAMFHHSQEEKKFIQVCMTESSLFSLVNIAHTLPTLHNLSQDLLTDQLQKPLRSSAIEPQLTTVL